MAYILAGSQGTVTDWVGTNNGFHEDLIERISPNTATIEIVGEEQTITPLGATNATHVAGVRTTTGTISGNAFATGRLGNVGLVAFTNGYVTHAREWDLTIETTAVHDITSFTGGTGVVWRKFRPDLVRWHGRYVCGVDNSTPLELPHSPLSAPTGATALTLTYGDDASDDAIAGNAFSTRIGMGFRVGDLQLAEFTFVGHGALTASGTNNIFGATTALGVVPEWEYSTGVSVPCVLTLNNGALTYVVADAFYRSITLRCRIGEPVSIDIDWQGSGAVTGTGLSEIT